MIDCFLETCVAGCVQTACASFLVGLTISAVRPGIISADRRPQLRSRQPREEQEEEKEEKERGASVPGPFLPLLLSVLAVRRTDRVHHQLGHSSRFNHRRGLHCFGQGKAPACRILLSQM